MAGNNLRVIYNNLVNLSATTITASSEASAATSVANLKNEFKSKVWRSGGTVGSPHTKMVLLVTLPTSQSIGGVVLPFCNISTTASIRIRGFDATAAPSINNSVPTAPTVTVGSAVTLFDVSSLAAPYRRFSVWNGDSQPVGTNMYAYGGGTYARCYIPTVNQSAVKYVTIEITDTSKTDPYFECSKLIIGPYWSPKYNTSFGLSVTQKDLSKHERTEAGDLVTNRGIRYSSLTFDLKYMDSNDRSNFLDIIRGNGLPKPVFVSLFPEDADADKELSHQIYGKLSQLFAIQHPIYEMYSTQIEIEEI